MKKTWCLTCLSLLAIFNASAADKWTITATTIPGQPGERGRFPQIAFDSNGNAISVWSQNDGTNDQIYYAFLDGTSSTWTTSATKIPGQPAQLGSAPQIAFDSNNNAIAVWFQGPGFPIDSRIYYAYFDGSSLGWIIPTTTIPGQPAGIAFDPQIAFDSNGNTIIVWQQNDPDTPGSPPQIFYARYDGTTWTQTATTIPGQPNQNGSAPQIAFDANGNAIAVWTQSDPDTSGIPGQIFYARYDGTTWTQTATTIPGQPNQDARSPQITFDSNNNAIAVWRQINPDTPGSPPQIFYARYDGTTWTQTATTIPGQPAQDGDIPQIAFDNNNNALAVWEQNDGSNDQIYYAYFDGSTWSNAAQIPGQTAFGNQPQIAFDTDGNALVVWTTATVETSYSYYNASTNTWTDAAAIPGQNLLLGGVLLNPQVAFDANKNALVVWNQTAEPTPGDFASQIFYARYRYNGTTIAAPTITSSQQTTTLYSTQADFVNTLAWDTVTDAVTYKVYGKLFGTSDYTLLTTTNALTFEHHNRCPGQRVTYVVTAIDSEGNESEQSDPVTLP